TFGQVTEIDLDPNNVGNYTSAPTISITGGGGSGAAAIAALALTAGGGAACQYNGSQVAACYPSVVNYSPRYYLIIGQAFDPTQNQLSNFAATAGLAAGPPPTVVTTGITGTVLVRMVNAGLRMHIPSIVGALTSPIKPDGTLAATA